MQEAAVSELDMEAVAEQIARFIAASLMAGNTVVQPDDPLESLGVDSMALLRILVFIEGHYGFWMPDDDLVEENIRSPRALARYICAHRTLS